jgi:hypothetical protein
MRFGEMDLRLQRSLIPKTIQSERARDFRILVTPPDTLMGTSFYSLEIIPVVQRRFQKQRSQPQAPFVLAEVHLSSHRLLQNSQLGIRCTQCTDVLTTCYF